MFATAKRAMPVIVPKFRAHKVSAAWRVPTLAQARLPVACHNPNKESFSRDQLRFQKSAAQGRDHSGAASTSAKPLESIEGLMEAGHCVMNSDTACNPRRVLRRFR